VDSRELAPLAELIQQFKERKNEQMGEQYSQQQPSMLDRSANSNQYSQQHSTEMGPRSAMTAPNQMQFANQPIGVTSSHPGVGQRQEIGARY